MELREKHGLSYNIEASYTPYGDCGIVAVYFSSDHGHMEQCIDLLDRQLGRLRTEPLTARRLSMAKKQFVAQLAISMEGKVAYCPVEQAYAKIEALTAAQLAEVAEAVFADMSRLVYR